MTNFAECPQQHLFCCVDDGLSAAKIHRVVIGITQKR